MKNGPQPLDLSKLRVFPLAERQSLSRIETLLVDPAAQPRPCAGGNGETVRHCAQRIVSARNKSAAVVLMYGAHLIKNGGQRIVNALLSDGWLSHIATNGAATIHDWELSFLGRTEESVRKNVATGTFGTWNETGRNVELALLAGALEGKGYGWSLGKFIQEDGSSLPSRDKLQSLLRDEPAHPLAPARAEALQMLLAHNLPSGQITVPHPWKDASVLAQAFCHGISFTVHPGIGYDIISNHPMFNGAVIGRAAGLDFRSFGAAIDGLDGGVLLSIGSAIMAPQVFEKSLSCVNNLRIGSGRPVVQGHSIYVVDLQDGGRWDWSKGEPPKTNPAYYLRFCKSFARMGGDMHYVQEDNVTFLHNVLSELRRQGSNP